MTDRAGAACRALAGLALVAALCACAPRGTVVLLPEQDGGNASVVVRQGDAEVVLDQPYAGVRQTPFGPRAYASSKEEVDAKFGTALAAQPARPTSFTLYFVEGRDEYTDESKRVVDGVLTEIAQRPVPDVVVIGHTDSVGSDAINDPLSRRRAETVRADLIRRGIAPENVQAVGRGKREPLVPTPEGVAEPRNRRVEILVR
jgi:outer membrane protein OmpA-like peptidoglycan-associated protein